MTQPSDLRILTINSGSSSIKTSLYRVGGAEARLLSGELEGIGQSEGGFKLLDGAGRPVVQRRLALPDHTAALGALLDELRGQPEGRDFDAVGQRIVHGGPSYRKPQRLDAAMLAELRRIAPFDPLHLPAEIDGCVAIERLHPHLPQVACFDTAFHRTLPDEARLLALPRRLAEQGLVRYGFHGLSYEYIMEELARIDAAAARGRVLIAHLGNGASMAAVHDGRCLDTTMGFTPTGGLIMGTRCGDLDPGVLIFLAQQQKVSIEDLNRLVNHESGLLGLSGISSDMRELLKQAPTNPNAAVAVSCFCYQARKFIGALSASLGGLDTLVFTAGIGQYSPPVRERICLGLGWLGVQLDPAGNAAGSAIISTPASRVCVRVMHTNEELMIARHTQRVLEQAGQPAGRTPSVK
jgi:acetate kinase